MKKCKLKHEITLNMADIPEHIPQGLITFSRKTLETMKKHWAQAKKDKQNSFEVNGHRFLTAYAKYLIDYLDERLPK